LTRFARDLYLLAFLRPSEVPSSNSPLFRRKPVADSLEREIQGLRGLLHTDRDPEGRAFVPLADAYRRARDLDRALEVVSIGLERHPTLASAYVVEARVHQDRGDSEQAAAAWERVLELDAENSEALAGLGALLAGAGDSARAAPLLDKARTLDADRPHPRERIAEVPAAEASAKDTAERPEETAVPPTPSPAAASWTPPAATASVAPAASIAPPASAPPAAPPPPAVGEPPARRRDVAAADLTEGEPEEPPDELPATRTLAELYARQGLHERAAQVYQKLLADHPHDAALRQRLTELSVGGAHVGSAHAGGVHDEDTEVLARALADRPGPVEQSATPFAWGAEEAAPEPSPTTGHTIASYFRSILDWPNARQVQLLDEAAAVEVDAELYEPFLAPETTPVTQRVVPIESLAPGKVVPISALAPDVIPVMTLAPEAVPIETLAPRGPATSTSRS
jgi:tetratricopeptide (TPR) repeat protein